MYNFIAPVIHKEKKYIGCDLSSLTGGVIANVVRALDTGNLFEAFAQFLNGCVKTVYTEDENEVTERQQIAAIVRRMPYRVAEAAVFELLINEADDDIIEGVYQCTRCGELNHSELIEDDDGEVIKDTTDHLSDLEIVTTDKTGFTVEIKADTGLDEIGHVSTMSFRFPTLQDCINAFEARPDDGDDMRRQFAIFVNALEKIDGREVEAKTKRRYKTKIFENLPNKTLNKIFAIDNEIGINREVKKRCKKCNRVFTANVDTSNFFVSALRSKR